MNPLHQLDGPAGPDAPPPVLLPYQQAWIADEAQLKLCEKGRRVGLTWAEAADAVMLAMAAGGSNYFYISATQDMAREFIEACAMWARAFDAAAAEISEGLYDDGTDKADPAARWIKTYEVGFPKTGRRIVALSSRPTNLRGKQGTVGIDEAAFAPELAGLLKAAMAMLLWGDRVRIWSTHDGVENPFNNLVQEIRAGKRGTATVHRVTFGDAVAQGLFRRVCMRRGMAWSREAEAAWVASARAFYGDDVLEELDCVPSNSAGAYLSLALIEQRMVPAWPAAPDAPVLVRGRWDDAFAYLSETVRHFAIAGWIADALAAHLARLSPTRRHVFGQDFARNRDQSVIVVLEEDTDLTRRPRLVVELANCPFSSQEQILFHLVQALPRFRGGALDASGNGAALAEAAAQRFGTELIEQVKASDAFYLAHMPKLKAGLQDGTLTGIPRDEQLRDDLRAIKLIDGVPKLPRANTLSAGARAAAAEGGDKLRRHGDFAIALFLAHYALGREAGEIAWTPVPAEAGMGGGEYGRTGRWRDRPDHGRDGFETGLADGKAAW
jgi:phage FluMu gp28-like protein